MWGTRRSHSNDRTKVPLPLPTNIPHPLDHHHHQESIALLQLLPVLLEKANRIALFSKILLNPQSFLCSNFRMTSRYVFKPASYNVEDAGSETFSNTHLLSALVVVPLAITLLLGISLAWFPLIFVLAALPTFAGYNYTVAHYAVPVRPQKGLPGRNIEEYLTIKDSGLKAKYNGKNKIPIETFFEAYFDGSIDMKEGADMLEVLEQRFDWARFNFTLSQAKFFLTQWIPETIWHSKKQDEDQVREHYDRGDDFYNWFCEYSKCFFDLFLSSAIFLGFFLVFPHTRTPYYYPPLPPSSTMSIPC
jgi:hypothetical protein